MRIDLTALLSAMTVFAVSCATGTSDGDVPPLSTGGVGGGGTDDGGPAAVVKSTPPLSVGQVVPGSYTLDVSCNDIPVLDVCLLTSDGDQNVTFVLPPGTRRTSIVYTVTPHGPSASGTVDFASQDPLDGTVHLHGHADAFSSVHIEVTGVMVVPQ